MVAALKAANECVVDERAAAVQRNFSVLQKIGWKDACGLEDDDT